VVATRSHDDIKAGEQMEVLTIRRFGCACGGDDIFWLVARGLGSIAVVVISGNR
jgi:hypothetical protein